MLRAEQKTLTCLYLNLFHIYGLASQSILMPLARHSQMPQTGLGMEQKYILVYFFRFRWFNFNIIDLIKNRHNSKVNALFMEMSNNQKPNFPQNGS